MKSRLEPFIAAIVASMALCAVPSTVHARRAPPRPVIERVQPTSGAAGTQIQIVGRNLSSTRSVTIGGVPVAITSRSPYRWTGTIPAGVRSGYLVFESAMGPVRGPYFRVTAAAPAPLVRSVVPSVAAPGSEVTLSGQNFSPRVHDNTVLLAGRQVVVRSATPTALRVIVPTWAQTGPFTVRVAGSGEAMSPPLTVDVGTQITSFSPQRGEAGTVVTIDGTGFNRRRRANQVYFGSRRARVLRASATQLQVRVPTRVGDGPILVAVRRGGRATSAQPFIVQAAPRIDSIAPSSGPPGTVITIRGANFGADVRRVRVILGGQALRVRSVLPDRIEAIIVPGIRSGNLEVYVHDLRATSGSEVGVRSQLQVMSFRPRSGDVDTEIRVRGMGFSPRISENTVTIGGTAAAVVGASPNELRVRVAQGTPSGTIQVSVAGSGTATSREAFMTTTPPFIASFSPMSGGPGTEVTITGANFGTNPQLVRASMSGRSMEVRSVQNNRLVVVVPRGSTSSRITINVSTNGGTVTGREFSVEARRRIFALTPGRGPSGSRVTIQGEGFPQGAILVQFAGSSAVAARRLSPVELSVVVPSGATTGPVTVLLPGGRTMTSPEPFEVVDITAPPRNQPISIQSIRARCVRPGCEATIYGTGFSSSTRMNRVKFNGRPVRVLVATPTSLRVTLPNAVGTGVFEIDVRGGGEASSAPFVIR